MQKIVDSNAAETTNQHQIILASLEKLNGPFAAKGHVTYPPLNLIPSTLWIPETERAGKNK